MGSGALNCRRWFVMVVVGGTIGSLCAALNSREWCAALSVIVLFPSLVFALKERQRHLLVPVAVLLFTPVIFFALCKIRSLGTPVSILETSIGKSAILELSLGKEIGNNTTRGTITYEAEAVRMLFPRCQSLHERTILVLRQTNKQGMIQTHEGDLISANVLIRGGDGDATWSRVDLNSGNHKPNISHREWTNSCSQHVPNHRTSILCLGTMRELITSRMTDTARQLPGRPADESDLDWNQYQERALRHLRLGLAEAHTRVLGGDLGALLASMVLGDKAIKVPSSMVNNFRRVGLSHVLAASGFNLTIVTGFIFFLGQAVLASDRKAAWLAIIGMGFYVSLAGCSPSIVRAAIMTAVLLIARMMQRQVSLTSVLSAALLITQIVDPLSLTDIGLQLSYAATVGITCSASSLAALCQLGSSRVAEKISEVMGTCLAAQLAVLPIQVFFFQAANIFFLPANILVLPLVAPITIIGFGSSFLSLCALGAPKFIEPALSRCVSTLDLLLLYPLQYMQVITSNLAACDWAQVYTGQPKPLAVAVYYVLWVLFLATLRCRVNFRASVILPLAGMAVLFSPSGSRSLTIGNFTEATVLIDSRNNAIGLSQDESAPTTSLAKLSGSNISRAKNAVERYLAGKGVHSFALPVGIKEQWSANHAQAYPRPCAASGPLLEGEATDCKLSILQSDLCYALSSAFGPGDWHVYRFSADAVAYRNEACQGKKIAVLVLRSPARMRSISASSGQCLSFMQGTVQRYLLVRLDAQKASHTSPLNPWLTIADIGKILNSCAIQNAILVMSSWQYRYMENALAACPAAKSVEQDLIIEGDRRLVTVTITRDQINGCSRVEKEEY